ncbi:MAG TPA: carboxypeptidase regulatory-like domain-containing protein [Methylomirabilota bacterium]|jgi:hypothetical protein|nr:carboxypeptidase regulatory-like domain-containing protein [Methylomirabilota bacterium]
MCKKPTLILCGLCVLFLGWGPVRVHSEDAAVPPAEKTAAGILYRSGGIGLDEREALRAVSKEHNLKVTFALQRGNYLSDVNLTIQDAKGRNILATVSQGPWFFATLPPGQYTVTAEMMGVTQRQRVQAPGKGQVQLSFYWK